MAEMTNGLLKVTKKNFFNKEEWRVLDRKDIFEKKVGLFQDKCSRP